MSIAMRLVVPLVAVSWLAGCATPNSSSRTSMPTPLPSPTSSPSLPSPSTSPSSPGARPSMPSSPSRSSSSSRSSPGSPGSPAPRSGSQSAPSGSEQSGAAGTEPGAQASADATVAQGGQSDLEVLEPEPLEDLSENDPTWEDPTWEESAQADGEQAEGGGAAGGGEGELASSEPAGGAAGGAQRGESAAGGASAGIPGDPAGGLDGELEQSLEVFDLEMQRRITILASARGGEQAAAGGGAGSETGEEGGPFDQTGEGSQIVLVDGDPSKLPGGENAVEGDGRADERQTGSRSGLPGGGSTRNEAYPRIPPDVGDGSDDDVVARQIREAALNESDPVLREKLWQEYRNYKKSVK